MESVKDGVRVGVDGFGTPTGFAENVHSGYWAMGWMHGAYRPLQTLILHYAARGELSKSILPRRDLGELDALIHRLNIPELGRVGAARLSEEEAHWLDAYREGLLKGLKRGVLEFDCKVLQLEVPEVTRGTFVSALMVSGFLGLAQGQERMERALVEAVVQGADTDLLEAMFAPHLSGWEPDKLARIRSRPGFGLSSRSFCGGGGSNGWAIDGSRSLSGAPILCGDPHLQVDQLPALFLECRLKVADGYWLGATIPGIPGVAVGRNAHLAWTGTFGVADNTDFFIEGNDCSGNGEEGRPKRRTNRNVELKRRFLPDLSLSFTESANGVLEHRATGGDGDDLVLANRWAGCHRPEEGLRAFMKLPVCETLEEAEGALTKAHTLSLHFVLASRAGEIRYCQLGSIPRRSGGWSGLYPVDGDGERQWSGLYTGMELPRSAGVDGMIVSANESRLAADGGTLSTLAQPGYRQERIDSLLRESKSHTWETMATIQQDVFSLQAKRVLDAWGGMIPDGRIKRTLADWDLCYSVESKGAYAFELIYWAGVDVLARDLGGDWMREMLRTTELSVWWCDGIDRILTSSSFWSESRKRGFQVLVEQLERVELLRWGEAQSFSCEHMLFGGLPGSFGFDIGPVELPGSIATVRQGNLVPVENGSVAVAPAYRMICDFAETGLWTSLPGGGAGNRFGPNYKQWFAQWERGEYHRLTPPELHELSESGVVK